MAAIDSAPTQNCLFFKLPAELRNRVYEHVLLFKHEEFILAKRQPPPPILRTCSQIRSEGSIMYYGSNVFVISKAERRFEDAENKGVFVHRLQKELEGVGIAVKLEMWVKD
ncbi:hypothetical protein LTR97_010456 [Elasticomyces elasticus]|uniref:Uncharacterized protein n=1 Tax=Elasticomyces elasticus TaxID=574655 RepID=A0AAN7VU33_9PEZI|nr:hypothetical protein LTR97_010456 [Elasticomyces elasticus]